MSLIGLGMNGLVAALLAVTIVYCFRLDKRLTALRSGQDGLKDIIAALDRATSRAQASLTDLKSLGLNAETTLKGETEKADALLHELKLMVQSADRVADRLAQSRPPAASPPVPNAQKVQSSKDNPGPIFDALRQAR